MVQSPRLTSTPIRPDRLVAMMSANLSESEEGVSLQMRDYQGFGRYPLFLVHERDWMGLGSQERVGTLDFTRANTFEEDEGEPIFYEQLRLKLTKPLDIMGARTPFPCIVNVGAYTIESLPHERNDFVYQGFWRKKQVDLTPVLPTEWFLKAQ
jgi:hypothetical protein